MSSSLQSYLQGGLLSYPQEANAIVPTEKRPAVVKRAITIRLPENLIALIESEAIADGRFRDKGRVYSPSATIERILRGYFAARPRRQISPK